MMYKYGDILVVKKECVCVHFMHEMTKYPRPGFTEADKEKYTLKRGDKVYFMHEWSNLVYPKMYKVQKTEGTEWEFDIEPGNFVRGITLSVAQVFFEREGFTDLILIRNQGLCGLVRLMFTVGLVVQLHEYGYYGRYCYPTMEDARDALYEWTGIGDPPGEWIKYKGGDGERSRVEEDNAGSL